VDGGDELDLTDGLGAPQRPAAQDPTAPSDGTLEAIVAHGLIGSLSVATGSASMLLKAPGRFDEATDQWLVESIQEQSVLVVEGMKSILEGATQGFVDAATNVVLAAGLLPEVPTERRAHVLEALLRSAEVLRQILGALVRGLPPDVVELLDELSAGHPSPNAPTVPPRPPA
jgi:hypothetical protein